ncbi:TonB-dependent receptor [Dyella monticola]|uniref:TonB-dependent receptor n=1 Tax=Dyella monticola TaxID=1927958 RepID=A0A370WVS5_9GAMM|nr:TonB-dependent receptor [Dyella monticola]RDS80234.1 TonB-dependent receptor [Dyella monticola]
MKRNKLALSLAAVLLASVPGAVLAQSAAPQAQQSTAQTQPAQSNQPPAPSNAQQLQTITVTGSALPRVDTETPSPVTVITAQDIARSGFTNVSDVVRAVSADNSGTIPPSFYAGFATGSSGVALRGLTVNSTLVLVDGKRAASYPLVDDGIRSFVDLNTLPLAAVERIEVLKDGASSIYGSDAIAGVVNIILKPSFQGVEGTAEVGNSQHGGGFHKHASLVGGIGDLNTDHYNAYFSAEWEQDQAIPLKDRSYPFNSTNLTAIGGPDLRVGNPLNTNGSSVGTVAPAGPTPGAPATGPFQPLGPCTPGTQLETVPGTGPNTGTYCAQDTAYQYGHVQQYSNKDGLYGRFTYKFSDTTKAYASLSYYQSVVHELGTPNQIQSSVPNNTDTIQLPPGNPSNPFPGQYAYINYLFGDIPSGTNVDTHNLRAVLDVTGEWGDWNYEASMVGNHIWMGYENLGFISYQGLLNAIANGTYNFANPSLNSAAVRNAVSPPDIAQNHSDMDVFDFSVNRQLFDLPGGPSGFAAGVQFRHEGQLQEELNPGGIYQGLGDTFITGSRNVSGVYTEFDAPLLESLEADVSGRFDHYPRVGNNFSPKVGLKWKPLDWVALRATYSKGFRAPQFGESAGSFSAGFVSSSVEGQGAPASFLDAHGNSNYVTVPYALEEGSSGNPNLKPEKSQSFTFGVVVQPLSWLNASLDYYNIRKSNVIVPADPGVALLNYYQTGTVLPGYTMRFDTPDPLHPTAPLRPIFVGADYINGNWLKTTGLDLDLQAHFQFSNGIQYISEVQATQIFQWKEDVAGEVESYVGTQGPYNLSSGAGTPRTRGNWANTIVWGPLSLTATIYFTSKEFESAEDVTGTTACFDALGPNGGPLAPNCTMASFTYGNLVGSYRLNKHITFTASVDNVTDRKPPLDPLNYAANFYNPTYDYAGIIGRFWNIGVKFDL